MERSFRPIMVFVCGLSIQPKALRVTLYKTQKGPADVIGRPFNINLTQTNPKFVLLICFQGIQETLPLANGDKERVRRPLQSVLPIEEFFSGYFLQGGRQGR